MTADLSNYTAAINNLPPEAFLGNLLWFSVNSGTDVHLKTARKDLAARGIDITPLRATIRPVDAFGRASRELGKRFPTLNGVRSEFMVRPVGSGDGQVYRQIILERACMEAGKKRRLFYEKVGELTFTRGQRVGGEYRNHGVQVNRTTNYLGEPLTEREDEWLTKALAAFEDRYLHLIDHLDHQGVRNFIRSTIWNLGGTCVRESGGLYFVDTDFSGQVKALGEWVREVGSEFHHLPLLNLVEQREMILDAFQDETVREADRLMAEISTILEDSKRKVYPSTFDQYGLQAAELSMRIQSYSKLLGDKAERAQVQVGLFAQQIVALSDRVREPKAKN